MIRKKFLLSALAGVLSFSFLIPFAFSTERCCEQEYPKVTVQGEGKIETAPDKASFNFNLRVEEKKLEKAFEESSNRINKTSAALAKLGIRSEDIKNQGYSYQPLYEGKKFFSTIDKPSSYEVTYTLKVTVLSLDNLGKILNALSEIPESRVENLEFASMKIDDLKRDVLKKAAEDARLKAAKLAEGAGAAIDSVLNISSYVSGGYRPVMKMAMADDAAMLKTASSASIAPSIESGTIEVSAQCTVVYSLK